MTETEPTPGPGAQEAEAAASPHLQTEIEAASFRRLVSHFRQRSDVQNLDVMNLAGFCRNCLARWYQEEAQHRGLAVTQDQARQAIYGMPYARWKRDFQK